jgi:transitional endoplasmic reticulum ATPase
VAEAPESDVGLGRARIDGVAQTTLDVAEGAIVEIVGRKATAAELHRLMREDEGKGIVRVDGLVRRNLGVSIGDQVAVRTADVLKGERVKLAPILSEGHKISFGEGIENFVKHGLLKRPVTKGDVVIVPGIALMGGALPFMVIKVMPKGIVLIVEDTILEVGEQPMMPKDLSPDEVVPELVRILRERTNPVLVAYADALADMPGDQGESGRRLIDAIRKLLDNAESGK